MALAEQSPSVVAEMVFQPYMPFRSFRLDHDKFYPEAHRVLKPGGCLAAWGYDLLTFPDNKEAQELLHKLFSITLGPYWHPRVDHVWQHYKGG